MVLDSYFETFSCDTVLINKEQGADIAIVGFDNIPISQVPVLTTINVPKDYMGALAARRKETRRNHYY